MNCPSLVSIIRILFGRAIYAVLMHETHKAFL